MKILEIQHVTKLFDGVTAVNDLSFSVERGSVVSIIGPNGSGKTTLINVLSGMLPMDGGRVRVGDGPWVNRIRPHQVLGFGITRTFQNVRLFEQVTVFDNIMVILTKRRVLSALFERGDASLFERCAAALRRVGLWEKRDQLAGELSYGQRKLLEVARVLATDAEVYLFDEPFAGLFSEMVRVVSDIIRELRRSDRTVILIEHNMDLIRSLSDHVIVMDEGILLAEGLPVEVLARREVVAAYLGQ